MEARWSVAVAVVSGVLATGGCAKTDASATQRDLGTIVNMETCAPAGKNRSVFFGTHPVANSDGVAHIEKVYLTDARDLELVDSFLVPLAARSGGGNSRNPAAESMWEWDEAVPAEGARVDADSPDYTLVVEVRRTVAKGSATDIRADYRIENRNYYSVWTEAITLVKGEC